MNRRSTILRSPRLARKERQRKTRRLIFLSLSGSVLVAAMLYTFNTPRFLLSGVEVDGTDEVITKEVKGIAERLLAGSYFGIIARAHPFFYPKTEIASQVLTAFPGFARVAVSQDGLSTLRLGVTPRTPVALWCVEAACAYLDEESVKFAEAPPGSERLYYRLSGEMLDASKLKALLYFFGQLENKELFPLAAAIDETDGVVVTLRNGSRLFIQSSEGYDVVLKRLEILLGESGLIPRQGATKELNVDYIDLRYGNKVYFKAR